MNEPVTSWQQTISQAFSRAAPDYQQYAGFQQQVAHRLLNCLGAHKAGTLVDVGAGPGCNVAALQAYCEQLICVDLAPGMVRLGKAQSGPDVAWLQADMGALPLVSQSTDCLFSSLAIQWARGPVDVLREWYRIVRPGGRVYLTTLLTGSVEPLRTIQRATGWPVPHPQFAPLAQWELWAENSGWCLVKSASQQLVQYQSTVREVLDGIRQIGASGPGQGYRSRQQWRQLFTSYEDYRTPAGLPLSYEVATLVLERPQ